MARHGLGLHRVRGVRRLHRDQRGTSLAELLVAMALTAIVTTLVVSIVATTSRTLSSQSLATANSETASLAMREVSRIIRSSAPIRLTGTTADSPAITVASATALTVTSYVDTDSAMPVPVRVRLAVTGRSLVEQRFAVTAVGDVWQVSATGGPTRTLARRVTTPAATPVFRFYDAAGVVIHPPTGGVLPPADLARIAAVRITLSLQVDDSARATSVALDNTVGLPNLGISRVRAGG